VLTEIPLFGGHLMSSLSMRVSSGVKVRRLYP